MGIRPEYRRYYRSAWRKFRAGLISERGSKCSVCGRDCPKYLNAAHVSHDPRSTRVALMCPACHNRHDAKHRLAVFRRNRAKRAGQSWLWGEVQREPYPEWDEDAGGAEK